MHVAGTVAQDADQPSGGNKADESTHDGGTKDSGANGTGGSSIRRQIAAFINRDAPTSKNASHHYNRWGEEIFDLGIGSIPATSAANMSKGTGRRFGAGGEFSDRMYINSWYLIGPFEGKHGREMFSNYSYPPEQGVLAGSFCQLHPTQRAQMGGKSGHVNSGFVD